MRPSTRPTDLDWPTPRVVTADGAVGGVEALIDAFVSAFGDGRRLVAIEATNSVETIAAHVAAQRAGHVSLLVGPGATGRTIVDAYRPDTIVRAGAGPHATELVHRTPRHDLHPELALLLSTSGSTGSPKLVRLSRSNLSANAAAIAGYLGLTPQDRTITSLPLHYCYGLSLLHASLASGGELVVTGASVIDEAFWDTMRSQRVSMLAGVPHTFDLIERRGDAALALPDLRVVTQAGGRMRPERVVELAELGRRHDWELFVMYGQTEATARMAYLPPQLAAEHPTAVGVAIPGGEIRIADPGPDGTGRIVYRGLNVMMGYAHTPADLARGHELDELDTGDLGHISDGLVHVTGRSGRFAKLFGLRVSLDEIERALDDDGLAAVCLSDDNRLVVAVEAPVVGEAVRTAVARLSRLPARCIDVRQVVQLPRRESGKPDPAAVATLLREADEAPSAATVGSVFAIVLGRDDVADDATFVDLGGDSFSYVELSIRLESVLGRLPPDWHRRTVAELEATRRAGERRHTAGIDTTVVLRALAIFAVVSSHIRWWYLPGGAHVLLLVAGFNFARFHLHDTDRAGWWRSMARPFAKIAAIGSAWVASQMLLFGGHSLATVALVNTYVGDPAHTGMRWRYWYVEAIVHIGLALGLVLAIRPVRDLERRRPLAFVAVLLAGALMLRFELVVVGGDTRNAIFQADTVVWCFLLGWLVERSRAIASRVAASVIAAATIPGFFVDDDRSWRLLGAALLLVWVRSIRVPRQLVVPIGKLASASLAIYLTHYLVYPEIDEWWPEPLVVLVSMGVGLLAAELGRRVYSLRNRNSLPSGSAIIWTEPSSSSTTPPILRAPSCSASSIARSRSSTSTSNRMRPPAGRPDARWNAR